MANTDPTGGGSTIALTIRSVDREFLRRVFTMARDGIRDELTKHPGPLATAARMRREEATYGALLQALSTGSIVPDRDARDVVRDLANVIDQSNEHPRVVAEHQALHGLLGQLSKGREQ